MIAAHRELEEETGYRARQMRFLTAGPVTAGLTDEALEVYLAQDLEKVGEGGGDESEDIVVHVVPLQDVNTWLAEQQQLGKEVDLKVYTGLYFLSQQ